MRAPTAAAAFQFQSPSIYTGFSVTTVNPCIAVMPLTTSALAFSSFNARRNRYARVVIAEARLSVACGLMLAATLNGATAPGGNWLRWPRKFGNWPYHPGGRWR